MAWDTLVNPGMLHCLSTGMTAFCRHGASVAGVLCTVQSCSEACAADAQLHAPLDRGRHIIYTTQCLAPTQLVESMDTLSNAQTWGLMVVRRSCASLNSLLVTEVRALVMQGSSRLQLSCGRRAQQSRRPSMCSRGRARWQRGRMRTSSYWTPRPGTPSAPAPTTPASTPTSTRAERSPARCRPRAAPCISAPRMPSAESRLPTSARAADTLTAGVTSHETLGVPIANAAATLSHTMGASSLLKEFLGVCKGRPASFPAVTQRCAGSEVLLALCRWWSPSARARWCGRMRS